MQRLAYHKVAYFEGKRTFKVYLKSGFYIIYLSWQGSNIFAIYTVEFNDMKKILSEGSSFSASMSMINGSPVITVNSTAIATAVGIIGANSIISIE